MSQDLGNLFKVKKLSFDDLIGEGKLGESDQFDIICSCDSLLHSQNRDYMAQCVLKLLKEGGLFFFTDYLVNHDSEPEIKLQIQERFSPSIFGSVFSYEAIMRNAGLSKVSIRMECQHLKRHTGYLKYCATTIKKDMLLEKVSQEFYDNMIRGFDVWI